MDEPQNVTVSWDAIKMLAVAVGVREAARRLGISEEMVKKRCTREGWLSNPEIREAAAKSVKERATVSHLQSPRLSPAQAMAMEIATLGAESRLGFARAVAGVAKHVSQRDPEENLADANNVKASAQTANLVHGWQNGAPTVKLRLDLLGAPGVEPETPAIDVESSVVFEAEQGANDDVDL